MGHEWEAGRFRLFISHVHTCREQAANLREALELYYIDGFVAHDDIEVNAAWRQEIESALKTMDGMVSLVSPDFHERAYCNQEVGFAMGRGLRVMSLNHGATPPGFLGAFQAMQAIGRADAAVAKDVFDALWKDPPTRKRMLDPVISRFAESRSWDMTRQFLPYVAQIPSFTQEQLQKLHKAVETNGEIWAAGYQGKRVTDFIIDILKRHNWQPLPQPPR